MTLIEQYLQDIQQQGYSYDPAQENAIKALEQLRCAFEAFQQAPLPSQTLWERLIGRKTPMPIPPKGVYFWGGVGRGKTYMMDRFFDSLATERKMRVHFHRFMYRVHHEMREMGEIEDPLEKVAAIFKAEADIICFDEFFVSDITDAMILATLMEAMFAQGMVLVATSNIVPNQLYRNGLQRARFLPAIELIEQNCHIINVDSGIDYRLRTLQQAEIYHFPLDQLAAENLSHYYHQLVSDHHPAKRRISIHNRDIDVVAENDGVLHATFAQLCQSARSQNDYIEIAHLYHTVLLAELPQLDEKQDDAARRFIALVDEFYERQVKLIISAEVALESLYVGKQLSFEFQRCQSRLIEMQSCDYLALEHLA